MFIMSFVLIMTVIADGDDFIDAVIRCFCLSLIFHRKRYIFPVIVACICRNLFALVLFFRVHGLLMLPVAICRSSRVSFCVMVALLVHCTLSQAAADHNSACLSNFSLICRWIDKQKNSDDPDTREPPSILIASKAFMLPQLPAFAVALLHVVEHFHIEVCCFILILLMTI
jgi:hypothetical protein